MVFIQSKLPFFYFYKDVRDFFTYCGLRLRKCVDTPKFLRHVKAVRKELHYVCECKKFRFSASFYASSSKQDDSEMQFLSVFFVRGDFDLFSSFIIQFKEIFDKDVHHKYGLKETSTVFRNKTKCVEKLRRQLSPLRFKNVMRNELYLITFDESHCMQKIYDKLKFMQYLLDEKEILELLEEDEVYTFLIKQFKKCIYILDKIKYMDLFTEYLFKWLYCMDIISPKQSDRIFIDEISKSIFNKEQRMISATN